MEFLDKIKKKNKNKVDEDVLLHVKKDRRSLPDVPSVGGKRKLTDRRGGMEESEKSFKEQTEKRQLGIRYLNIYEVYVRIKKDGKKYGFIAKTFDVSMTGIGLTVTEMEKNILENAQDIRIKFHVEPGTLPEGFEMNIRTGARMARTTRIHPGKYQVGLIYTEDLAEYAKKKKDRYILTMSSALLFFISLFILLMRSESIIYLKYNSVLYLYSIIAAVFLLSRYLFGALYRPVKIDPDFTPGVTVIIPCFNEEEWIQRTILSCVNQNYPTDKLEVIVVDDQSSDKSVEKIKELIEQLEESEEEEFKIKERVTYMVQPKNAGKREALAAGLRKAQHEYVIFVDSDSFLEPYAVRNLVQPFKDPKMAGVTGRTDVANTYTNSLTRLQSVRYYIAFRIMKAAESFFHCVTCLSGPLSCYKKELVMENLDKWLNQTFLGQKATFGDDRSLTNIMLRNYRTYYQDTAICSTIVPNNHKVFLKQQMRWKRSWLRESFTAGTFIWKKEPFAAVFFYIGLFVPILAPVIVIYNLFYVPLTRYVFPTTFIVGMVMMAMMMSTAQLFLRKSSTWIYGFLFCMYYEMVLLWQMPIAILTFWKSTWGTRMTTHDVEYMEKKKKSRKKKHGSGKGTEEEKEKENI
ncbi:MAG: glycosyltransferase family 2 protein [Butyrivibrio sp.]|nr:glycosyltransferase family 2 protein [Butyrivibrio sp.]